MSVTVLCPNLSCRTVLQVPESIRGKKVRCGNCGVCFLVPIKKPAPSAQGLPGQADRPTNRP